MNVLPKSLAGRLLLAAAIFITSALIGASVVTDFVLDRFLHHQIDQQLDAKILSIADALRGNPNTMLGNDAGMSAAPFDRPGSGWYWQVSGLARDMRSASLQPRGLPNDTLAPRPPPPGPPPPTEQGPPDRTPPNDLPRAIDTRDRTGRALHIRSNEIVIAGRKVRILASAPQDAIVKPLHQAMGPVLISLAIAGFALLLATLAQVRLGLRPLQRLRQDLAEVRSGRRDFVSRDQPREIAPLVGELNQLIDDNREGLARARRHVANLAHGLKTPLASLELGLSALPRDLAGDMTVCVQLMDRRIRHHLSRARFAALGGAARASTPLAPRLKDICDALMKIHAEKSLILASEISPTVAVACEMQDIDELFGNLIDNAFKWAGSKVFVRAATGDRHVDVIIDDDGPGLPDDRILDVLRPGHRLDEATPGYGFGLPIAKELAELYGGSLALAASPAGGLRVTVRLPLS